MTQPSDKKQVEQKLHGQQTNISNLTIDNSEQTARLQESPSSSKQKWSLKTKAIVWALAVSMLPVLAVGTATYYLNSELISKQTDQARLVDATGRAETEALQGQQSLLLVGTGATAVLVGAIAAILANRAIRPVLNAARISTTMVNKLRGVNAGTGAHIVSNDELVVLETNISLIKEQLPDLLWKQEVEAEYFHMLMNITRRIQKSLNEEDVLKTTVEEVRTALKTDRVVIFRFKSNWDGTFVEESVASGLPKMLWATVSEPDFEGEYIERYRLGCVRTIDDIYQANLSDSHIGMLERFGVKSSLIAPILDNNELFGLLIAHQCSRPRVWQQSEIDLLLQIATQVRFALDYARLLERVDTKADQAQVFIDITRRIRKSLNEEDVLKTTVEEIRKELSADRVIVYGFDANWYGTVIAESVVPGFPKALRATISDPCFAEGYVELYQAGRVNATNNIYEAGLTDCYLSQLEPFAVKANLVASILKDDQLFGLLIAHQCSGPRDWQQSEINLFAQIATQVGFALDHARLLKQVEQAYQVAEGISHRQRQQQQEIQRQVSQLLISTQTVVQSFSTEVGFNQMKLVTSTHNQIQMLADSASGMVTCAQQAELQEQQLSQTVQDEYESMNRILDSIAATQQTVAEVFFKVERLDKLSEKFYEIVSLMSTVVSQVKRQAMLTALEASHSGEAGQKFASIAEKLISLVQPLDLEIAQIKPLVAEIQTETNEVIAAMKFGAEQASSETELVKETQQKLEQIVAISAQMKILVTQLAQAASIQAQTSTSANQSILVIASIASQTSEQALAVADSLANLAAFAQKLKLANG